MASSAKEPDATVGKEISIAQHLGLVNAIQEEGGKQLHYSEI